MAIIPAGGPAAVVIIEPTVLTVRPAGALSAVIREVIIIRGVGVCRVRAYRVRVRKVVIYKVITGGVVAYRVTLRGNITLDVS